MTMIPELDTGGFLLIWLFTQDMQETEGQLTVRSLAPQELLSKCVKLTHPFQFYNFIKIKLN